MKNTRMIALLAAGIVAGQVWASAGSPAIGASLGGDDLTREGKNRDYKDALEGKAPPALELTSWMNTGDKPLDWDALRGKVVVLDFWGTW